jgi:hypothetical protein
LHILKVYSIFICLPILTQFWMNCIESFRQYVDGFPLSFTVSEINLTDFQQYFSYIMATSFSVGRSRSTRWEPPTMGKQLVSFITCGCESDWYLHFSHSEAKVEIVKYCNYLGMYSYRYGEKLPAAIQWQTYWQTDKTLPLL